MIPEVDRPGQAHMTAADVASVVVPRIPVLSPGGFGAPVFSYEVFSHV
ncbi:hypothetical protein ACTWPT_45090 [Nonomuraea sp. 3N208]